MAGEDTRKDRVLGVRLEATTAQGPSLDVDCRSEKNVGALCVSFVRQQPAYALNQVDVEGCANGRAAWQTCGRCAVEEMGATNAIGTVREANWFDAQAFNGRRVPPAVA